MAGSPKTVRERYCARERESGREGGEAEEESSPSDCRARCRVPPIRVV